jgi:hypothetical protein
MTDITDIVVNFLSFQNNIQTYHWVTRSYSRHKASGKLYKNMNELIDKFVEVLQGARNRRADLNDSLTVQSLNDTQVVGYLRRFREYLVGLSNALDSVTETNLINLRDEMVAAVDQSMYLFSLS